MESVVQPFRLAIAALASAAVLFGGVGEVEAQWEATAPALSSTAALKPVVQVNNSSIVQPSTGTAGVMPGGTYTIAPGQDDPATGTSAKAEIRLNTAGTVTLTTPTTLDVTIGGNTFTMAVTFACAIAETEDAQGLVMFPGSCSSGYSWSAAETETPITRWVMVGFTIAGSETGSVPAGTYTATLTLNIATGGS